MLNVTRHPVLQNLRVEISDECAIPGMMCASVMLFDNQGIARLHVCVECNLVPSGSVTVIGFVALRLFTTGAPSMMKWLVAPESDTAHSTALVTYLLSRLR